MGGRPLVWVAGGGLLFAYFLLGRLIFIVGCRKLSFKGDLFIFILREGVFCLHVDQCAIRVPEETRKESWVPWAIP